MGGGGEVERAATVVAVVARVAAIDKITNLGVGSRLRELSEPPRCPEGDTAPFRQAAASTMI